MSEFITWIAFLVSIISLIWILILEKITSLDSSSFIAALSCLIALASALIAKSNVNLTHQYVNLTQDLVEETRKMREIQTEPIIYAYIEPKDDLNDIMDMFIKNIGLGLARDIKFNVSDFRYDKNQLLKDVSPIKDGIKYLAPNQKVQIFSVQTFQIYDFNPKDLDQININIVYEDSSGKKKEENIQLHISTIKNVQRLGIRSSRIVFATENISKEIKKISKEIFSISSNLEEFTEFSVNNKKK